ncbi:GNAT family N-acetyltransferase [Deinococcus sp. KNUC1210]|uniref:GNAT family N-acetyltransferase n=1 Tax=Deinococcus sp. KNUC1210 TaxID=2917691 RepID=UPI001EF02AAD|nr:GNAT family N-acetyltransferase [Deinococcus sp. KNUC1210]ULH15708.1 GNAT family N-acetyltransferase [Deinococcus sp. KNUC1210]
MLALKVHPGQDVFAGQMPSALLTAENDAASEAMALLLGPQVIGFYRLDFGAGAVAGRDFGRSSVGLKAFFLGAAWQGRGLGMLAVQAVLSDLKRRQPAPELLALSVNLRNAAARHLYLKAGFADHGELYLGGAAGPQYVMLREI